MSTLHIEWVGTPNYAFVQRPVGVVAGIVLHSTEGELAGSLRTLQTPYDPATGRGGASAHYLVARVGTVYQLVDEAHVAFHVAAFGAQPSLNRNQPTWLRPYAGGAYSAVNAQTFGIELEGFARDGFTTQQYTVAGRLCWSICVRWAFPPTLQVDEDVAARILSHAFLQRDRYDPGPRFDWEALRRAISAAQRGSEEEQGSAEEEEKERPVCEAERARIAALEADQTRSNVIKAEFEAELRRLESVHRLRRGTTDRLIAVATAGMGTS